MSRITSAAAKYAILFFGCILFHILGTWNLPLIDRDEPRFAEASREMIERGNYIVPYFNNQLRLDKPPLAYWAQVASYRIFGENDFAARFPSAIAAAATAVIIATWGRRALGERLGWWAAIIFTLSLQTFVHAKAAVADMWLVLFVTLAHWSGFEVIQRPTSNARRSTLTSEQINQRSNIKNQPSLWWWIFYLSLALGFLAKGPIAWTPLLTVAAVIIYTRDWQLFGRFKFIRGIVLMLIVIALWGIPALVQTEGEFFVIGIGRHVVSRSFSTLEGHGASSLGMYVLLWPFYFVSVFISFFPWSIKLPWLVRKLWRNKKGAPSVPLGGTGIDAYLLSGIAVIFIIFSFVSTKLPHYTLPAFPLLALLLAHHWQHGTQDESRRPMFARVSMATACIWIAIALTVPPMVARFFPAYEFFQVTRACLRPNMQFAAVEFQEPSLVWYFRSRLRRFFTPLNKRRAAEFMSAPDARFIILPTDSAGELFPNPPETWQFFRVQGLNIAKARRVDLTLVLKPE